MFALFQQWDVRYGWGEANATPESKQNQFKVCRKAEPNVKEAGPLPLKCKWSISSWHHLHPYHTWGLNTHCSLLSLRLCRLFSMEISVKVKLLLKSGVQAERGSSPCREKVLHLTSANLWSIIVCWVSPGRAGQYSTEAPVIAFL